MDHRDILIISQSDCLQSVFPTINCRIIIVEIIVISALSVINVVISNILYLTYMDYPIAWRQILRAKVTRDGLW